MRRIVFALFLIGIAASALAADPLMVRVDVYQRLPQLIEGEMAEPESPATLLPPPAGHGWPSSFDDLRSALTQRRHNGKGVMIIGIQEPKPLTDTLAAAFFIPILGRAIEFKQEGTMVDVTLPLQQPTHVRIPATPGTTVFGASDEQIYLAATILPQSQAKDDTIVIMNGAKPLDIVSQVEATYPKVEGFRNRSGNLFAQLRIEKDGSVGDAVVLGPVNKQIDDAAIDAFKKWRFVPAKRNGQPVTAYMVMMTGWRVE